MRIYYFFQFQPTHECAKYFGSHKKNVFPKNENSRCLFYYFSNQESLFLNGTLKGACLKYENQLGKFSTSFITDPTYYGNWLQGAGKTYLFGFSLV